MNEIIWISLGVISAVYLVIAIAQLRSEISRMQLELDLIAKHLGVSGLYDVIINEELKSLILEGKKIEAIKKFRIITGSGLKEAHDYIEELSKEII